MAISDETWRKFVEHADLAEARAFCRPRVTDGAPLASWSGKRLLGRIVWLRQAGFEGRGRETTIGITGIHLLPLGGRNPVGVGDADA